MLTAQIQPDYDIGLSQCPMPACPPAGALVRVVGCGVCGSDLDKFIHQKSAPGSVLGHEVVGVIEALADGHPAGWQPGDRIVTAHHVPCGQCHYCQNDSESMCRQFKRTNLSPGGFAQYIALSKGHLQHTTFKIPDETSWAEASCVEPLACILRAVRRGQNQVSNPINGSVAVIGLGFIGLLAAQIYQNDGQGVYGFDLDRHRLALAQDHGFVSAAFHPVEEIAAAQAALQEQTPLGQVDTVFLSAVNEKTLALALDLVRDGGQLIAFTSAAPGTQVDPSRLYFREINLITSYSPSLCDLKAAARMIFHQEINVQPLVTHQFPLSEIRKAFDWYQTGQAVKVFIHMGEPT